MTVEQFRSNPDLVKEMRQILENPTLQMFLEAMDEESPVRYSPSDEITPHRAHILLGELTGWAQYGKTLLSGGRQPSLPERDPEMTYPPEEPE